MLLLAVFADMPLEAAVDLRSFGVDCLEVVEHLLWSFGVDCLEVVEHLGQRAFVSDQLLESPLTARQTWKRERQRRQAASTALSLVTHYRKCVVEAARRGQPAPAQEAVGLGLEYYVTSTRSRNRPQVLA